MKRFLILAAAAFALATSSGCCCAERFACYGLFGSPGPWGPYYAHEGPYCGPAPRGPCGYCDNCATVGKRDYDQEPMPLETGPAERGAEDLDPTEDGLDDGLYDGQQPAPAPSPAPQANRGNAFYLGDFIDRMRSKSHRAPYDHYQVDYESVERGGPQRAVYR